MKNVQKLVLDFELEVIKQQIVPDFRLTSEEAEQSDEFFIGFQVVDKWIRSHTTTTHQNQRASTWNSSPDLSKRARIVIQNEANGFELEID